MSSFGANKAVVATDLSAAAVLPTVTDETLTAAASAIGGGAPVIGDDVFIGVNSTVLGPIRIGDRVRIAANTAVTTNVPPDSVVVGSPARIYPSLPIFAQKKKAQE